ncbi:MAG TPA: alpha/beta hydrolase-fold protein [Tenuifilaceae bacterium]|nr:alpha/beta hydrolase-fold protein [Tenuifilaceae bacterium]HPJ44762.1 alpha/beta hydrolase-fold protein [Tenuifilaceae bacterium]HPQ33302.1 alpha/beta hydrolase-fold protein [Tenuifilaceae bacterium]
MKKLAAIVASLLMIACSNQDKNLPIVSSGALVRIENFDSKFVDSRNIDVWIPYNYSPKNKYAVVYMHDGQMLFDSTKTWNKQEWKVDEIASKLLNESLISNCIVVGVWNNDGYRHSEYFPQAIIDSLPSLHLSKVLDALKNKPQADNYLKFLVEELKPFIDKNYSTKTDKENTFLMGSSMGGVISIYAICKYPDTFGGAACLSTHWPLYIPEDTTMSETIFNHFKKFIDENIPVADSHKIYFDFGTETLDRFYEPYQQKIDSIMIGKGYNNENWITLKFDGEEHSEHSWSKRLAIPLEFLLKK